MKKPAVEFIGTFFLVFTVGMTVINPGAGAMAPLAIGAVLMTMIFAGGHVSGGHFNPAVTLGVFLRGKCSGADLGFYWVAQVLAGGVAAALVATVKSKVDIAGAAGAMPDSLYAVFLAEFLFTFALVWVVLNVATAKANVGNSFYGLAIGLTVTAGAYAVGPVSGAAFNPAVVVGAAFLGLIPLGAVWIYLIATFAGGAVAAVAFKALARGEGD
jgi:aquaporin Z